MIGNIYLKQLLLKDTFAVKGYNKGLLIQLKEEEVYKVIKKHSQMMETVPLKD